ncbi:hypothetical protein DRQ33_01795 [bacterium]|nr:MAG: hypothetical protein DRQ33_01795 [bacterium]
MLDILLNFFTHLRDTFNHHILFGLSALLLAGFLLGKLAQKLKLPTITGFIVAGFLLGESTTGIVHKNLTAYLTSITELALGIIAITIGSEFSFIKLKRLGIKIIIITVLQLLSTFIVVTIGLNLLGLPLNICLLLGAIATATAPAATVAIVQSMRVRGEFVDYLYGIVALDDAGCIILFSVVFAVVGSLIGGVQNIGISSIIFAGILEIAVSILLGLLAGIMLHIITSRQKHKNELLILSIGMVFLLTAISVSLHFSLLLSNMMMGATVININQRNSRIIRNLEPLTPPLYAAFFAIAGTELRIDFLTSSTILLLGLAYILFRGAGKYLGVYVGAITAKAPQSVRKNLGLCMLPQAGVAIGLVLFIQTSPIFASPTAEIAKFITLITNIVLFSVFVNELVGPPLSKLGLTRGILYQGGSDGY